MRLIAGQGIEEAFEGEASEAAIKSIDKIKQNNKTLDTNFHSLLNTFEID